jgi:hypothetical protein
MATITPTDTINAISEIIEEDLSGAVPSTVPKLDSYYQKLKTTAMGVTSEGIGRDFKVIHPMKQGVAGTVKWVSGVGGAASVPLLNQIVARASDDVLSYPGLAENIVPGHLQMTVTLARAQGNILLPIEYMKADKLSATMVSAVKEIITGAAENIALSEIHQFYRITSSDAQGIATVEGTPTFSQLNGAGADEDKLVFVVGSGSIRNFYPGMLIDFHDPTGGAKRTYTNPIVVDGVRYLPDTTNDTGGWGQVTAVSTTAEDLDDAVTGIADGDVITRLGSEGNGPLGPEDWMKTTGTIFGLNVATYQQFQSIVQAVSGVLTEPVLNRYFGRFFHAYGMQNMPDSIVTSIGVTNAHVEQNDGLARFSRQGVPLVFADGYEAAEVPYRFNGRNVSWDVSAYMPSSSDMTAATQTGGRLWAMKTRDQNLMRYVPPLREGAAGQEPITREVEFVMPLGGPLGIFKPRHNSSGDTVNFLEAPFDRWVALAPKFLPGIVMTGLTESI